MDSPRPTHILRNSIRVRLALSTAGFLLIGGLVLGGGTSYWLAQDLEAKLAAFAKHECQELALVAAPAATREALAAREPLLGGLFPEEGVLALELWSLEGEFVVGMPAGEPPQLGRWDEGLAAARRGERVLESVEGEGKAGVLRTSMLVEHEGRPHWIAVSLVEREGPQRKLWDFVLLYLTGLALAVVLGGVMSWVLVGRALGPVQAMVADADVMARAGPTRRLVVPPSGSELRPLASLLNTMLSRTESTLDQLRRFTAHAGHELRTPLTRIRGEAEMALATSDPQQEHEVLGSILEETDALRTVLDALLELAQDQQLDLDLQDPLDLADLVGELVEQARVVGEERKVEVEAELGQVESLRASRPLLARVLWNLLDNAIKFSPDGGTVRVELDETPDRVEVRVLDDGPGLGGDDAEALFEPFRRGSAEGERGGYGLGLALARTIARRHRGDVTAHPREPGGSCFTLTLPLGNLP